MTEVFVQVLNKGFPLVPSHHCWRKLEKLRNASGCYPHDASSDEIVRCAFYPAQVMARVWMLRCLLGELLVSAETARERL